MNEKNKLEKFESENKNSVKKNIPGRLRKKTATDL